MVFRRKRVYRRKRVFKKRTFKRRFHRKRRWATRISYIKRSQLPVEVKLTTTISVGGSIGKAWSFQLSDVVDVTELSALFDQYKLNGVAVRCIPRFSQIIQNANSVDAPRCYAYIDYDDANTPVSEAECLSRANCRIIHPVRGFKMYFKPSLDITIYQPGSASAYARGYSKWIDLAYPAVPHYGLKFFANSTSDATNSEK